MASIHFVPHPLCLHDPKIIKSQLDKQGVQSLQEYFKEASDARWAASHLVRAIAQALTEVDAQASFDLSNIASTLETPKRIVERIENAPGIFGSLTTEQKQKIFNSDAGETSGESKIKKI